VISQEWRYKTLVLSQGLVFLQGLVLLQGPVPARRLN
jgi:hypothetical protein